MKEHHTPGPLVTIRMKDWEDIRAQLNGAKGSLGACRQREDALRAELDSKVADICNLGDNLRVVEAELAESRKEAEALRGDIEATERSAQWYCNDAIKLANQVRALEDALAQIANIMGGPTMTYSPENEVSEWRGRWQSCAGIVARALSSPAAEAKEKI